MEENELNLDLDSQETNLNFDDGQLRKEAEEQIIDESILDEDLDDDLDDSLDDEEEEELTPKEIKGLIKFVKKQKIVTDEEVEELQNDKEKLDELIELGTKMARHLTYMPKKHFGVKYKKKRQKRNKQTKMSRRNNR